MEDQRLLIHNSEEDLKKEQIKYKSLQENFKAQKERIFELEREMHNLNRPVNENLTEKQLTKAEIESLQASKERLTKEMDNFKRELNRNKESSSHLAKENDHLRQQLAEYVAREEFIKELYNRQQENKDDKQKLLLEKEQTIKNLEEKLREQNQQLEDIIKELGKEQMTRRTENNENEVKLRVSFLLFFSF